MIASLLFGIMWFAACGYFLVEGLSKITITEEWVTLSIGKHIRKRVAADTVRTIAKTRLGAKGDFYQLVILTVPPWEIEMSGEKSFEKGSFAGSEVKFQKNRPDWRDVCLEEGLLGRRGFQMEFTPERKALLKKLFPNAEYREGKKYTDPPALW